MAFLSKKLLSRGGRQKCLQKTACSRPVVYCRVHTVMVYLNMECFVSVMMTERHFSYSVQGGSKPAANRRTWEHLKPGPPAFPGMCEVCPLVGLPDGGIVLHDCGALVYVGVRP